MTEIKRRLVIVESPFKGKTPEEQEENVRYARACLRDCIVRHNEAPFASHLLYTQEGILNNADFGERMQGIEAGFTWRPTAEATVIYTDRGISEGMNYGIKDAEKIGQMIEYRNLPKQ